MAVVPKWLWVVRLLRTFSLAPVHVSRGVIVPWRRPVIVITALVWSALYLLSIYMLFWSLTKSDDTDCFEPIISRTFRVYNKQVIVITNSLVAMCTNAFCLVRLFSRDLIKYINRNVELYGKVAGDGEAKLLRLSSYLKFLILFVFLSPFVVVNVITSACSEPGDFRVEPVVISALSCLQALPSTGAATVFFILLDTAGQTLAALHQRLLAIYQSRAPRPFLGPAGPPQATAPLTLHGLHSLRQLHFEVVEFMEQVMSHFQLEILFFFIMSFCQNVIYNYSVVFNHREMLKDRKTFYFVCHSLYMTVNLVTGLWMTCAGPTRIKDKHLDLMNSTARLSTLLNLPSDLSQEIRIFQLQVRNHKASFEVFGMFELSYSLLFMMCASIVSYIVVLIQFSDPEGPYDDLRMSTFHPNNSTPASPV